ncbi:hypothetical protein KS4_31460 [Poriferisphaera corsica]|uniref:Lipoprotein n=1 Tax=Poriferisphaera corsica TaxID=2528020 RepID=A0A517YXX1_9BACT|nr:hypothetical protein [Poriferisphaera corsica]QDU35068.1 hypothetical protein KS4_31460 [Poriferisphaera corsica]
MQTSTYKFASKLLLLTLILTLSACMLPQNTNTKPIPTCSLSAPGIAVFSKHRTDRPGQWLFNSLTIYYQSATPQTLNNIALLTPNTDKPIPLAHLTPHTLFEHAQISPATDYTLYRFPELTPPQDEIYIARLPYANSSDTYFFLTTKDEILLFSASMNQTLRNKDLLQLHDLKTSQAYQIPFTNNQIKSLTQQYNFIKIQAIKPTTY